MLVRRQLLLAALCAAAILAWLLELRLSPTSIGLPAWLAPPLVLAAWTRSARAEIRADGFLLARLYALLVALGFVTIKLAGMHPVAASCFSAAALQLAILAPLVVGSRLATSALGRSWGVTRRARVGAGRGSQLLPTLVVLPLFLLAHEVHRAKGTLEPAELEIRWPAERVAFHGAGDTPLAGLWFENPAARGAVLLIHGIGAEKTQFLLSVEALHDRGWHVFTYDQRDHGESGGLTSTLGMVEADDAVAAWQVLLERTKGAAIPRVVMGVSLGGAAAQLAQPRLAGLSGMILDSTFADVAAVAVRRLPLGPAARPALALARLAAIPIAGRAVLDVAPIAAARSARRDLPVLLFHARQDPVVPFTEGEALARAYGPRATLVAFQGAGHAGGVMSDGQRYREALDAFARGLARTGLPAGPDPI